jgi:hypothetical protein
LPLESYEKVLVRCYWSFLLDVGVQFSIPYSQGEAIASGRRKLRNDADRKQQETNILINAINGIANIATHLPQKLILKILGTSKKCITCPVPWNYPLLLKKA